jgi:Synaptobrevin
MMMMDSKDEQDGKTSDNDDEPEPDWDERLTRDEVFSDRYRPTMAEAGEVSRLQDRVGITNNNLSIAGRSFRSVMAMGTKQKFTATQAKSWSEVTQGSVLLKRGLVNLRLVPDHHKEMTADRDGEDALGPIVTCHLCLFTKGMSVFTLPESKQKRDSNSDPLLVSLPWTSVTRLVPDHEKNSIQIERSAAADDSILVLENSLAEWNDPITSCLLRYLEINDTTGRTTTLGWQHLIVYRPAFSEAVSDLPLSPLTKSSSDMMMMMANAKDEYNLLTPLLYAVKLGHMTAATSLLQHCQADPNQPSGDDGTLPLYWADSPAMTELLVAHGAKKVASERQQLFGRVEATQAIVDRQRQQQQQREEEAAAVVVQTEMQQNMHLLNERGQKIAEMDDKARELNDNAAEFKSLSSQLKSQMKQKSGRWGIF